jgi:hypothetical protein
VRDGGLAAVVKCQSSKDKVLSSNHGIAKRKKKTQTPKTNQQTKKEKQKNPKLLCVKKK